MSVSEVRDERSPGALSRVSRVAPHQMSPKIKADEHSHVRSRQESFRGRLADVFLNIVFVSLFFEKHKIPHIEYKRLFGLWSGAAVLLSLSFLLQSIHSLKRKRVTNPHHSFLKPAEKDDIFKKLLLPPTTVQNQILSNLLPHKESNKHKLPHVQPSRLYLDESFQLLQRNTKTGFPSFKALYLYL